MPLITEKGLTAVPFQIQHENKLLYTWLSQLQLVFPKISTYEESFNLASINAATYSVQTFTVSGLNTDNAIIVNPPVLTAGLYLISYTVSATDTLRLVFYNSTAAPIDESAALYKITAIRK